MPRTTVNLDVTVLRDLKRRAREQGKSLGEVISEISARALASEERGRTTRFVWRAKDMQARVDLEDKEALRKALGGS